MSRLSWENRVFSVVVRVLALSPASEASCERIFSRAKCISGKRRYRLSDAALNSALHCIVNGEALG